MGGRGSGSNMRESVSGKVYKTRSNTGIAVLGEKTTNGDVISTIRQGEFRDVGMGIHVLGVNVTDYAQTRIGMMRLNYGHEEQIYSPEYPTNNSGKWRYEGRNYNSRSSAENAARRNLETWYRGTNVYTAKAEKAAR